MDYWTTKVIHFLLEIKALHSCLSCLKVGGELTKMVVALVVSKILMHEEGKHHCCTSPTLIFEWGKGNNRGFGHCCSTASRTLRYAVCMNLIVDSLLNRLLECITGSIVGKALESFGYSRPKDEVLLNGIAQQLFDFLGNSIFDESFKQWEGLIELLSSETRMAGGLEFLHKYMDFKKSLQVVQDGVFIVAAQKAGEALMLVACVSAFSVGLVYGSLKLKCLQDVYKDLMVQKFGTDTANHPIIDTPSWEEAKGGRKKGRLYGFGLATNPLLVLIGSTSTNAASSAGFFTDQVSALQEEIQELRRWNETRQQEMERRDGARQQEMERRESEREEARRLERKAFERQITELREIVTKSLPPRRPHPPH